MPVVRGGDVKAQAQVPFAAVQDDKPSAGGVRSVLTALRVLEEVAARQPVGVSDLARALKVPRRPYSGRC